MELYLNIKPPARDHISLSTYYFIFTPGCRISVKTDSQPTKPNATSLILVVILFAVSGIMSTYTYVLFIHGVGPLMPGILYTISTIILFSFMKVLPAEKPVTYYVFWMLLLWIVTLAMTLLSSYFVFLAGIGTSGASAVVSMLITSKFIKLLKIDRTKIFLIGSLPFIIADILTLVIRTDRKLVSLLMNSDLVIETLFTESIFFWQMITGITLYYTLRATDNGNKTAN